VRSGVFGPWFSTCAGIFWISGTIQGIEREQYDFTDEQYRALAHLTAALVRIFPRIELAAPRTADGAVVPRMLTPEEMAAHSGLVGHYHVTDKKVDPGPAFDWDRLFEEAGGF